jgi:anti-sigma-K factor RskA
MTDHRAIIELIPVYVLHALEEDEAQRVAAHLESCQLCRDELAAYEEAAAQLANILPLQAPPDRLKARLMEHIQPASQPEPRAETRPSWWERAKAALRTSAPVWAPVSAVLILVLLISNILLWQQVSRPASPEIVTVALTGTAAASDAQGILFLTAGQLTGVLVVSSLASLPDDQQYQLWLVEEDGSRDSGALFSVDSAGRAQVDVSGSKALPDYTAFGVTVEPAGGSPGPTGQQVLGSDL